MDKDFGFGRRGRPPSPEAEVRRRSEISRLERDVAQRKKKLQELKEAQNKAEKAARRAYVNQKKFSVGGLAQIAGLLEVDAGFLLGALLSISDQRQPNGEWPSQLFQEMKRRGDQLLAERASARKTVTERGLANEY